MTAVVAVADYRTTDYRTTDWAARRYSAVLSLTK